MKTDDLEARFDGESRRRYLRHVLNELRAVERMLRDGCFESGTYRIGAEQEMFLVDRSWRPAPAALDMLAKLDDPHFTTELGMFNLELNLDPCELGPGCLSGLERQIHDRLDQARRVAADLGIRIVLTGILPTIRKSDLKLDNMVPKPRYRELNRVMTEMKEGGAWILHLKGTDEILFKHDSVMVEACNASFQVHLQVGPDEFPNGYNIAQVLAGPLLSCSANSPLLFGKRLWAETRTALFQQSVDTRSPGHHLRDTLARVTFGSRWLRKSVLEIWREDVARFRALVGIEVAEDPFEVLGRGEAPALPALRLQNGTIYRWNRACYGVTNGRPHLRIENRVMPSGPSVIDQVANSALWLGAMRALMGRYPDITRVTELEHAQMNFTNAARQGLSAHLTWLEGEELPAEKLVLERLVPLAREGLRESGVASEEIDRYLGVVSDRVSRGRTGARWLLRSLASMKDRGTEGERLNALVAATVARQATSQPVADWELAELEEAGGWKHNYAKVEQFMTTNMFTVHPEDPVDLVANVMEWERVRHVPVEDASQKFLGLVSYRAVLRLFGSGCLENRTTTVPVSEIMQWNAVTVPPDTSTLDAIRLMREKGVGCLPVVLDGKLVGVVTERDLMVVARELLEEKLGSA